MAEKPVVVRRWEWTQTSWLKSLCYPQDRADKQNHLLWALTGHVQRQQREMAEQQQWLRQIQQR